MIIYRPKVLVLGYPRGGTRYFTDTVRGLVLNPRTVTHEGVHERGVAFINPWGDRNVEATRLTFHLLRDPLKVIRSVHTYYHHSPRSNYQKFIEMHGFRAHELIDAEGFAEWWIRRTEYLQRRCRLWGRLEAIEEWWSRFCKEGFDLDIDVWKPITSPLKGTGEVPYKLPELEWKDLGAAASRAQRLAEQFGYGG